MASCFTTLTVQSSFSSPCSKPQLENDVFLNFRGEDTRNNFTDHLYRALEGKRIKTFKDDTKLEPGNPISQKLLEAIEKSRIAVIILSKKYAFSTWCLNELVKIIECKERGLIVLPVFYHVEPKIVRHQKKTFAVAFAEHENRFQKEQVEIWRKALKDVAELSGKTLTNGPEGKFIQEIVDWIFTILKDKSSIVYEDGFVGIDSRVEEMNSFLDMNSNDVRFIGICGKSGMGKTTLARFVFDKICNQFEACSFLENVKEVSKARGLETLQEQLLCDISKGALRVRDVSRGIQAIRNILRDKKVLIVVDDASEKRHLEALAGKSWFGPRSRIIVTTEKEDLLKSYEIQTVYKADGLNNDEAQCLFSHKAHYEIDFLDLGNDFVTYAQGSPLVLKVLGSHLCKRTKEEWEIAWNQLKKTLNKDIPEKLRIAYDGLEELEKKLFLHIACFFKGEDQNRIAAILESVCYWDDNIRKLIDKSLITIEGGKLCMHHLIQQMGWKIVCGESKDPGRRSRLWDCTDVLHVLQNNIGTDRIEGMVLNLPPNEEQEELNAEPFSKMNKLKLLKICKLHLPCLSNLSNELLLLEWHEYPLKSLPKSFQPPELVELIMHHSSIKQLPSEFSNLHKLKLIDLSDSQNLCQTPKFNGLPNIERLIFQGCTGLQTLHPSVGSLERLILLNLKDCKCLENLPHEINLKSLKILILSGCSKLKKFPKIGRNMTSMLELYLDRTAVEELPSSIKHLTGLTLLNLQDCKNLSSFPTVICSLISLEILILSGCKGQQPKASYFLGLIPTLSSIGTTLTPPYTCLTDQQPEPEPISMVLPLSFSGLSSLVSLDLSGCNLLDGALPDDLSYLSSLTSLNLRNNNFTCLPCSISQLLNLKLLFLDHCSKLQSLPYLPLSTQFVSAQGCTSLENYSNQVIVWTSGAARFTFINCHGLADDEGKIADVPLLNIHFQSLWQRYMEDQILQIKGFCLVLPQIEIPEWFKNKECGPSVRIPLPPNLFDNRSWKGIALCVIFVVPPNLIDVSPGQDSKYFHEFICHFDMDGSFLNCPLVLRVPKETFVGSFGLWLYISHARFTGHFDEGSCIGSLIRPKRLDIQIKMCGARILYEQDMLEFVQNSRQENFRSCDDLSRGHEKFIEDHMSSSQSYDLKLKQKLNSLLSTLYQVDWAKNHLYDYIFHQIARPPCWFTRTNLGHSIEMPLPADVHDNSTWLGFTICASYCIQMRAGFSYKLHSTIFLRNSSLSAGDEVSFASYTTFPLSTDVFDESPQDSGRLAVFYIPRRGFQLKQCDHIGALFKSSDPAVQFEMCGICLVYEQNVPEFVQTLVECMLGSPDANHQSFSVRLSDQLGMMQYCNHEKENCCPFVPERRLDPDTKRMLLPNNETIQEECTSRETISNQVISAGVWKNSSRGSINLGTPFGNGQYGSKMSGHLECWIKPYLQNHHRRRSTFNRCSPQSEIPMWFTKKINGSSVRLSQHSNFYKNPDWIGFAISAVFSSHKNLATTRSRFSHMAICHLKTNLGCMNPLLYCGIREEHVLTLSHQRIFLWESIIRHQLLSPKLSECTWVEFSFVSDSLDVSARKCAVDLVYQYNLVDFTLTVAPCITSCDDPFTYSGSEGFYEGQTTSGQHSYGDQHPRYQLSQTAALDFNPSTSYNCCFPPSEIQDWFSHQNHGCSATMDLPSNLFHNSNWMGLVLYASFSIHGDPNFILSNLNSGKSHSLYCQCQMSMANVDDQTIAFSTSKEEIKWLLELGEFIWISYVPGEPFKNMLQHCSRIEASFVSDWPGMIVQKCALQLLYQHDQVQFEQELQHCNNLIPEKETETQLGESDLQVQVQSLKLQSKPAPSTSSFPYTLNEMGVSSSSSPGLIHPDFWSSDPPDSPPSTTDESLKKKKKTTMSDVESPLTVVEEKEEGVEESEAHSPVSGGPASDAAVRLQKVYWSYRTASDAAVRLHSLYRAKRTDHGAATRLQKVYRGYWTRRRLADSAVVAEELWLQATDFAGQSHNTISFFNSSRPETGNPKRSRISVAAARASKRLSKDARAQELALQHWLEAIDPRHRYGRNLHYYYEEWQEGNSRQPFFYWLDVGDGRELNLKECPRSKLQQQCIKYLGPQEREHYEYIIIERKIIHKQTGDLLDTTQDSQSAKWIFVISTSKKLYVGQKKKGVFHHRSFFAGGATLAAGKLVAEQGILKSVSPYSGYYRPTEDSLDSFICFLKENGLNLDEIQQCKANEDSDASDEGKLNGNGTSVEGSTKSKTQELEIPDEEEKPLSPVSTEFPQTETKTIYERTLSCGLQSLIAEVPKTAIWPRISSKMAAKSCQLGNLLSFKWSSGAGPRIFCLADYPAVLRQHAWEAVNQFPRTPLTPLAFKQMAGLASLIASSIPRYQKD